MPCTCSPATAVPSDPRLVRTPGTSRRTSPTLLRAVSWRRLLVTTLTGVDKLSRSSGLARARNDGHRFDDLRRNELDVDA